MRAIVLNDGTTWSSAAGCKLIETDTCEPATAVRTGNYGTIHEFTGAAGAAPPSAAFSTPERQRLRALLAEFAQLNEGTAALTHTPEPDRAHHAGNALLLQRLAELL
jgi:hypothetical protein